MKTIKYFSIIIFSILLNVNNLESQNYFSQGLVNFYDSLYSFDYDSAGSNNNYFNNIIAEEPYDSILIHHGILPEDIVFSPTSNRFFIYSSHYLLVIDAESKDIISKIGISSKGNYSFSKARNIKEVLNENKLAYNQTLDHVWCLTNSGKLLVIDAATLEEQTSINLFHDESLLYSIIKYDQRTNRVYITITLNNDDTQYIIYNADAPFNRIGVPKHFPEMIRDFEIDEELYMIYLAKGQHFERWTLDCAEMLNQYTFTNFDLAGEVLLINDEINLIEKVFCFPIHAIEAQGGNAVAFNLTSHQFEEFAVPYSFITAAVYNAQNAMLYYAYTSGSPDPPVDVTNLIKLNPINYHIIDAFSFPATSPNAKDFTYFMEITDNNQIYLGQSNNFITFNCSANNWTIQKNHDRWIYYSGALNSNTNKIWVINILGGFVEEFDENGEYQETINLGGEVYHGCYNNLENKGYFYGNAATWDPIVYIYNFNTNTSLSIPINDWGQSPFKGFISGMAYYEENNKIYISAYNTSNQIKILDGSTDDLSPEYLDVPTGYVSSIYISGNKLYCACVYSAPNEDLFARINIYNLINNELLTSMDLMPLGDLMFAYFSQTNDGDVIVSLSTIDHYWGRIAVINKTTNEIEYIYQAALSPKKVVYSSIDNRIFFYSGFQEALNRLYSIDLNSGIVSYLELSPSNNKIIDIEYCQTGNDVAVLSYLNDPLEPAINIQYINSNNLAITRNFELSPGVTSIKYNKYNGLVYAFMPFSNDSPNHMQLLEVDKPNDFIKFYQFASGELFRQYTSYPVYRNDIIIDPTNSKIHIPAGYHSSIYSVNYPSERNVLQPHTWNWISFPRLDQENSPVPARPLMESIDPFPTYLKMLNRPLQESEPPTYDITYDEEYGWSGELGTIQSTFGYKLETDNVGISYLPLTGSVLDPETEITIFDEHENWVGYFLPETQHPFDAIPASVLQNLYLIRAQYWSCINSAFIAPPYKSTASSTSQWRCACNQLRMEIAYDDMVIMVLGTKDPETFVWNRAGGGGTLINKEAPEYFQFSEQADYEAIFIDLDSIDLPEEIGAFAGDSCIGATKVLPDDTAAMICAYTQGFEGEEISFELMYPTKATRPVVDDYLVFNDRTRINESRKIMIGEKQPFYLVSFNKNKENSDLITASWIHCVPNPARDEATITYFIPAEARVQIILTNILGKEIMHWDQENQTAGEYRFKVNTSSLPAGYYLVSAKAGNQTCAEKLLIVH